MGGGQANSAQAKQAADQQTAASKQDMAISKQNSDLQKRMTGMLFGSGAPGSTGTLSQFMDPNSINTKGLNSAYQTQFNEGKAQLGQSTAQQRGSLAQQFANSGASASSTPNGFMADQMNKLGRGQADAQGSLYSSLKGSQYADALNNFWNASNIASGNAASAGTTAAGAAGNSGTSSASIYGTAGQYHPSQGLDLLSSAIGAAGQIGAGMMTGGASTALGVACPVTGSKVLMANGRKTNIEDLRKGDVLRSIDGSISTLLADPTPSQQSIVNILTRDFKVAVSASHWFDRPKCGYTLALEAFGTKLRTLAGDQDVTEVTSAGEALCWDLTLDESHSYCVEGFWSLG